MMGQEEVFIYLKKHKPKKYSSMELSQKLKVNRNSVARCLGRLIKAGFINTAHYYRSKPLYWFSNKGEV